MKQLKALLLLGALVPLVTGCSTTGEAEEAPSFVTVAATTGNLLISVEATGSVEPIRDVEVKSKASGEILRLYVDVGDEVQPGALLAEIDPRDVRNAYEQSEADLQVAQARMEISQAQLERSTELLDQGVITQQDFESRNLDHANAVAQLVRAETNFELAELRLSDVQIRAPMAGTVIQRDVEEGTVIQSASQNVSGGTTLMVMANLNAMQVRTNVDETDIGRITPGKPTQVTVEAYPNRTFRGIVEKVEPQAVVQQNVTMFPVIIRLDNEEGLLRPGMNAEVVVELDRATEVTLLPNNAVVQLSDAMAAAGVLGLDTENMDLRSLMAGGRGGGRPGTDAASGSSEGSETASGEGDAQDPRARMAELRRQVEAGEITQDSMRAIMAAARERAGQGATGGQPPAGGDRRAFGAGGMGSTGGFGRGAGTGAPSTQRALAFVQLPDGAIEPRVITTGLSDWDNTQILDGLEPGENVAVVGAAALQAAQQEFLNRFRGGSPFGGGRGRR